MIKNPYSCAGTDGKILALMEKIKLVPPPREGIKTVGRN